MSTVPTASSDTEARHSNWSRANVRELVARETECCAFLSFSIAETGDETVLTVDAPEEARAVLDEIFAPFVAGADAV